MADKIKNNSVVFLMRNIPRGLRQNFKAYCVDNNYTMSEASVALWRKAVKENMKFNV